MHGLWSPLAMGRSHTREFKDASGFVIMRKQLGRRLQIIKIGVEEAKLSTGQLHANAQCIDKVDLTLG